MAATLQGEDDPGGILGRVPGSFGVQCVAGVAESFVGATGGIFGTGEFINPQRYFTLNVAGCKKARMALADAQLAALKNTGGPISRFPTPAPATVAAPSLPPFIFVLIAAILFTAKGWN